MSTTDPNAPQAPKVPTEPNYQSFKMQTLGLMTTLIVIATQVSANQAVSEAQKIYKAIDRKSVV